MHSSHPDDHKREGTPDFDVDGPGATAWTYDAAGNALTEKRTTNSEPMHSRTLIIWIAQWRRWLPERGGTIKLTNPGGAQRPQWGKDVTNGVNYATAAHYFPPGELGSLTNGSSIFLYAITTTAASHAGYMRQRGRIIMERHALYYTETTAEYS